MRSRDREEMTRALERAKLHAFSIPNDALQSWTRRWRVWGKARPPVFTHVPAALLFVEQRLGVLILDQLRGDRGFCFSLIQIKFKSFGLGYCFSSSPATRRGTWTARASLVDGTAGRHLEQASVQLFHKMSAPPLNPNAPAVRRKAEEDWGAPRKKSNLPTGAIDPDKTRIA